MKNVNQKRRSVGKLYCHSIREEQCSSLKSRFALNLCIFKYFQYLLQILSKFESGDSIPIGNFKFLHLGCERSEEGIKFLFREKDVDNNKQRIRSIEKQNFYFHHPLPSSVQPRRVRIYGTNEKENHAGGKKKKQEKRGRRELEENNCTERSFEFLFHTCQSSKRTISAQPSISKRPRAGSYAPNDINPISSVPTQAFYLQTIPGYAHLTEHRPMQGEFSPRPFSSTPREIR